MSHFLKKNAFSSVKIYISYLSQVGSVSPYNYEGLEVLLRGIQQSRFTGKVVPEYIDRASRILGFLIQYKR